ncbi:FAD-dependent oxidoreductase [Streptomonospora sediminis]
MSETTTCAIIGGGPAGMMLGLLLARAGVQTTVLEKHADFLRDFRGDTVHPTTMDILDELGLGERFAALPQSRIERLSFDTGRAGRLTVGDFTRLRAAHPYIAMVPQWDLLTLLAGAAAQEPAFTLRMSTEATGLLHTGARVAGVSYSGPEGPGELRADVTVACDGRWSMARGGLPVRRYPVAFDAWWFRVPVPGAVAPRLIPRLGGGKLIVPIPRDGYLQVAYIGPKGTDADLRTRGVAALRSEVAALMPDIPGGEPAGPVSMDDVKHLDVRVDRLRRWHREGLLCIGDAAHAMSPMGGVGINLAIQDAVAAAALLAGPLKNGRATARRLAAVRRRRRVPTAAVQALQRVLHKRVVGPVLAGGAPAPPALLAAAVRAVPRLSALPAYVIGVGLRPEHAPAFARRRPRPVAKQDTGAPQ